MGKLFSFSIFPIISVKTILQKSFKSLLRNKLFKRILHLELYFGISFTFSFKILVSKIKHSSSKLFGDNIFSKKFWVIK